MQRTRPGPLHLVVISSRACFSQPTGSILHSNPSIIHLQLAVLSLSSFFTSPPKKRGAGTCELQRETRRFMLALLALQCPVLKHSFRRYQGLQRFRTTHVVRRDRGISLQVLDDDAYTVPQFPASHCTRRISCSVFRTDIGHTAAPSLYNIRYCRDVKSGTEIGVATFRILSASR